MAGKSSEMTGRIAEITRLTNSHFGNPRFEIVLVTGNLERHTGDDCDGDHLYRVFRTASDASVNYEIGNKGLRADDLVTVTVNGRGTIDYMRPFVA